MDPKPPVPTIQNILQPGISGQMSTRPAKYLSMEYITLYLKSTEYDFLRELSKLKRPLKMHMEFHVSLTCLRQLLCASDMNIHTLAYL